MKYVKRRIGIIYCEVENKEFLFIFLNTYILKTYCVPGIVLSNWEYSGERGRPFLFTLIIHS